MLTCRGGKSGHHRAAHPDNVGATGQLVYRLAGKDQCHRDESNFAEQNSILKRRRIEAAEGSFFAGFG